MRMSGKRLLAELQAKRTGAILVGPDGMRRWDGEKFVKVAPLRRKSLSESLRGWFLRVPL